MSRVSAAVATGRRARSRGEHGFALAAVLGVIALTSLVIAALLGLLLATIFATSNQEQRARELRASDGAIEAAIAQARTDPSATDPCAVAAPLQPLTSLAFDQETGATGDDVDVDVSCRSGVPGDALSTADQVRLVGRNGYQGGVRWNVNCAANASGPGCLPWTAATGSAVPSGLVPSLVHSGPDDLRFDSGITVRHGAAVLRNPVDGSPAVISSGQYEQGDAGPGAAGSQDCGILAPGGANDAGVIDDLDDAPTCGSADAAAVEGDLTDPLPGFAVPEAKPAVPTCSGTVIDIQPGTYDAIRTRSLNTLLATCPGRTFHFLPGAFYIDANSGVAGSNRFALVLADPTAFYVFGAASGWDPSAGVAATAAASDPEALLCDPEQDGTTLVLSGRTELRHLAGRAAICPAFNPSDAQEPLPAIYQVTSVPGVTATPVDPLPRTYTYSWNLLTCGFNPTCTIAKRHDIRLATTGTRSLDSVKVLITGTEPANTQTNFISNRTTRIEVWPASGAQICSTGEMAGVPNGSLTSSFELRTGGCAAALTNEASLDNVTLRVFHSLRLGGALVTQGLTITRVGVEVNPAIGRSTPAEVEDPSGNWDGEGNVALDDTSVATPVMTCPYAMCAVAGPRTPSQVFTHSFELTDIDMSLPADLASVGGAANITSLRVLMKIDPSSAALPPEFSSLSAENFRPEMTTRLRLTTPSGDRCNVTGGFANSSQQIAFDLLDPASTTSGCDAVLSTIGQLEDADLSVSFELPCVRNWLGQNPAQCLPDNLLNPSGKVWEVRPPSVRNVVIAASSDSYAGPVPVSQLNIGVPGASGASSDFHAAGSVWMPSSDLDLHWKGSAAALRPLVAGDLVLNGMGSDMTPSAAAGVVCCSLSRPDSRTVTLVASVGGSDRLAVTVRFTDVDGDGAYSPGHAVDILEWTTCRRDGCGPD